MDFPDFFVVFAAFFCIPTRPMYLLGMLRYMDDSLEPTPVVPQLPIPPSHVDDLEVAPSGADREQRDAVAARNAKRIRQRDAQVRRAHKANALAREAHEQGVNEALSVFVPEIIETVLRVRELSVQSFDLLEQAMAERDVDLLKAAAPVVRTMLGESNRLVERVAGKAVARQEVKQDSTHTETKVSVEVQVGLSLSDLLALDSPASEAGRVVEARVVSEDEDG